MAVLPPGGLFLGLDSSTQSLKATALDSNLRLFASESIQFDSVLSHYGTKDGVIRDPFIEGKITAPPLMWIEALEILFSNLKKKGFPFDKVTSISGSGQQHGSVYWKKGAKKLLNNLKSSETLVSQLLNAFSTNKSPVWMDSSTTKQCEKIEKELGGSENMALLTGSRAYERFTGPQISKIYEEEREVYEKTERISLVSSFGASILIGDYASIDYSDGAGMNLMDFRKKEWSPSALNATAPGLEEKLGSLSPSHSLAGKIHPFFVERYGFSPECVVVTWSGDNPCSLAGLALDRPGDLAISFGTSDTVFGVVRSPSPGLEGHIFPNPVDPSTSMAILCYKNASLTRQEVRDRCSEKSWEVFNTFLTETPPLNDGHIGFYYRDSEILPPLPAGTHRFVAAEKEECFGEPQLVSSFPPAVEVRAVVEGQLASMRGHMERVGMVSTPKRVIATGGGSANHEILRLTSSIFGCTVHTAQRPDSASLGAALRAAHGWICHKKESFVPFASVLENGTEDSSVTYTETASVVDLQLHQRYGKLVKLRMSLEKEMLER